MDKETLDKINGLLKQKGMKELGPDELNNVTGGVDWTTHEAIDEYCAFVEELIIYFGVDVA